MSNPAEAPITQPEEATKDQSPPVNPIPAAATKAALEALLRVELPNSLLDS